MIEIRDLVKNYDGTVAVDGLSLSVPPGEILGLVGPNGAGKTTTLRCLAGIIPVTSGSIALCGHDLVAEPVEARRSLAFVPDEPHLFENLTAWDHLMFFARVHAVDDGEERAARLLERAGLDAQRDSFPGELSRGMKQKLILACALLHRPKVLVLDEPLTGLDPAAMRRTRQTILRTAERGAAVLVSSHMLHLVEAICGRILILKEGRKAQEGSLGEIRAAIPELAEEADLEEVFLRATGLDEEEDGNGDSASDAAADADAASGSAPAGPGER